MLPRRVVLPVVRGAASEAAGVIGVITIDMQTDRYFGNKNNRSDEDRATETIRPYAKYIALIHLIVELLSEQKS